MEEKKNPVKSVKVILRPSSPLLKIVVIALIVFSMAALIALRWVRNSIRTQTENMRGEAAAVEQANSDLQEKIDDLGSVQSVADIAREELGLVDPNTVIITPEE